MFGRNKDKTKKANRKKLDEIVVEKVEKLIRNDPIGGSLVSEVLDGMEQEKLEAQQKELQAKLDSEKRIEKQIQEIKENDKDVIVESTKTQTLTKKNSTVKTI